MYSKLVFLDSQSFVVHILQEWFQLLKIVIEQFRHVSIWPGKLAATSITFSTGSSMCMSHRIIKLVCLPSFPLSEVSSSPLLNSGFPPLVPALNSMCD